jgi:negative regulator of sigma-B (phosphoserine phosphatase)
VDGTLHRADRGVRPARESLPCRGGVAGYQLPSLRAASLLVAPGDTLVLATDGIGGSFNSESPLDRHPQEMADHIVARYGKETDDALALVVRYVGRAP